MLPSRPVDWLTATPVIEKARYPSTAGEALGDLYRPPGPGPHPGMLVCLGVVPFEVDHPQVPVLGKALARSGFAALLYWSPAMRDFRLDPEDVGDIALAYRWLIDRPDVDPNRSGLLGTCVGGSFALMAAANPLIRERVGFVAEWAAYSSMWTLAQDIASATRPANRSRQPWVVDPLTRKVYVHSMTAVLETSEAVMLRAALAEPTGTIDMSLLSEDGRAIYPLLTSLDADGAQEALERLPAKLRARLDALSPIRYLKDIRAPLITIAHDLDDAVIPIDESRRMRNALAGRAGVHYTELGVFQHMDPTKKRVSPLVMVRELGKFYILAYPLFRQAVGRGARPASLASQSSLAEMGDEKKNRFRPGGCGCLPGCGGFVFVFLLGGALSLFNATFGLGVSVGVPFTQSNVTVAGSIGAKDKAADALPSYAKDRLAGNQNFVNNSTTLTVGPAEGVGLLVIGKQEGAPAIDLYVVLR